MRLPQRTWFGGSKDSRFLRLYWEGSGPQGGSPFSPRPRSVAGFPVGGIKPQLTLRHVGSHSDTRTFLSAVVCLQPSLRLGLPSVKRLGGGDCSSRKGKIPSRSNKALFWVWLHFAGQHGTDSVSPVVPVRQACRPSQGPSQGPEKGIPRAKCQGQPHPHGASWVLLPGTL